MYLLHHHNNHEVIDLPERVVSLYPQDPLFVSVVLAPVVRALPVASDCQPDSVHPSPSRSGQSIRRGGGGSNDYYVTCICGPH